MKEQEAWKASDDELPSITLLVPCFNEEDTVARSIQSFLDATYPKDKLFVCAIDDGSTDATRQQLRSFVQHPQVTIFEKGNGGRASALNYVLPSVTTDLVVSVDADTILEKNALCEIALYFIFDKKLAAVGGTVLIDKPTSIIQKAQNVEYQMFSFTKKVLGLIGGVMAVPGAFSAFRTSELKNVGGFRNGHNLEDVELTYRFQAHGYHLDHCHTAIAYTVGPRTLPQLFRQRLRWGYGFVNNTYDYRHTIFNKKFGNFGFFTLPTGILAYLVVIAVFFISWYKVFEFLINQSIRLWLLGFDGVFHSFSTFDWFFINTEALALLSILMYGLIFYLIYMGRRTSRLSQRKDTSHVLWFLLLFNFVAPFWSIKTIYDSIRGMRPRWR